VNINHKYERNMLLIWLAVVGLLGILIGHPVELLAIFLLAFIVFQYRRLQQLYRWSKRSNDNNVPFEDGLLGQIAEDIFQSKKQRLAQKESVKYQLERFKKLISVFPDGVVILSLSNEIQWFNDQAARLLILKKEDTGQLINHLVRHPRFTSFLKNMTSDDAIVMEAPIMETNWSAEKIEIRLLPYGDDERLLLVRDVTKVERTNQVRKDFVSNASHELRTPLTVMKGYVEMLLASTANEKAQVGASLRKVDQQVVKMQTMIEELLTLSRLEEGKVESLDSTVNLRGVCEQVKSELQSAAQQRKQIFNFDIPPSLNLKANKSSVLTIMRNLVGNAINYADKKGEINVGWLIDDQGNGVLYVKDNGKGIAARHLARLTERFYRVAENNVMNKTGTGLGLAIVKHELERHEAQLRIDSTEGKGSCFQCVFPAERVDQ
jgi:two-component system, OmpR family, phosphate regulon sensor histidine kinase PhoR